MASRTKQKEEARARRVAEERAAAERARRQRRTRMLGGVLAGAIVVVVVAIIVSSSGGGGGAPAPKPGSAAAKQAASAVSSLLSGIPQSGMRLGSRGAHVVVTEFGDLECPVCRDFALGSENQLIANDVRSGIFPTQQAAAYAAGLQGKGWNYALLF